MIEQMFGHDDSVIGLLPGERPERSDVVDLGFDYDREDDLIYEITCREMADGWVEPERHVLPDDLEKIPPGLYLSAILSSVDASRLNGHDAVRFMKAHSRLASHHEAGKLEAMAEVAYSPPGDADSPVERDAIEIDYVGAEIAAALTLTRSSSKTELNRALSLHGRLRRVRAALAEGLIDVAKTKVFDQVLGHLPDETVEPVLDQILSESGEITTGQLGSKLSRLVLEADPDGCKSAFQDGLADRGVTTFSNPDQTGSLLIHNGDPVEIAAARAFIEELARSLKTSDEPRTLEEIRADVALDLLQGKSFLEPGAKSGGRTNLWVSAETLMGISDAPGELEGYGPVMAEIARKTARENLDGEWVFTVTDNGRPVATGTLSRRPTASQRRYLEAVYPTCVMVGCRQPAYQCDLDHRKPRAEGGATHTDNLEPLCRHHHMVRHHGPWRLDRLPNGDHQWTSPLGHTYIKRRGPPD